MQQQQQQRQGKQRVLCVKVHSSLYCQQIISKQLYLFIPPCHCVSVCHLLLWLAFIRSHLYKQRQRQQWPEHSITLVAVVQLVFVFLFLHNFDVVSRGNGSWIRYECVIASSCASWDWVDWGATGESAVGRRSRHAHSTPFVLRSVHRPPSTTASQEEFSFPCPRSIK